MQNEYSKSLIKNNTFSVDSIAPLINYPENEPDLIELASGLPESFYVLGEGSNTLFVEEEAPYIIKPRIKGIQIKEDEYGFKLVVGASENWHDLVTYCLSNNMYGLENLALIPGSVGAAPVQNIGAYGVEFSRFCESIEWFDFEAKRTLNLTNGECGFEYRSSNFKKTLKNKGIITHVNLYLPKAWQPVLDYGGLSELSSDASAQEVMAKVIEIRSSKLPDPDVLPNAGSFFKNPIISVAGCRILQEQYPNIPTYKVDDKHIKIAAGWLIEQAGLKGYQEGGVGVHDKQALVIVNYSSKYGRDILKLARYIREQVVKKFGITIEPEVRFVSKAGESSELFNLIGSEK